MLAKVGALVGPFIVGRALILTVKYREHGVENSLMVKLNAAAEELQDGNVAGFCDDLQAFINESKAQSGKKLTEEPTEEQANQNIAEATLFRLFGGC